MRDNFNFWNPSAAEWAAFKPEKVELPPEVDRLDGYAVWDWYSERALDEIAEFWRERWRQWQREDDEAREADVAKPKKLAG